MSKLPLSFTKQEALCVLWFQTDVQEVLWLCLPLQVLRFRHYGTSVIHTEFPMNFCSVHQCSVPRSYGSPKCSFWLALLWLLHGSQTLKGSSRLPCTTKPRDDPFGNNSQAELQVPLTLQCYTNLSSSFGEETGSGQMPHLGMALPSWGMQEGFKCWMWL